MSKSPDSEFDQPTMNGRFRRVSKKNAPPSAPAMDLPKEAASAPDPQLSERVERHKASHIPKQRSAGPKR